MNGSRILPALVLFLLVVFAFSLWSASRPFQFSPLHLLGELFSFYPDEEELSLPQAEPGREDPVDMILIPAGPYLAGIIDEKRGWIPRRVYLDAFWIDVHEVTNQQYSRFVEAVEYPPPPYLDDRRYSQPDAPVVGVSWYDARAYCWWTHKRLPSEAEWEKAARGTQGRLFPWGDVYRPSQANLLGEEDGYADVAPVGHFPGGASPFGVQDMMGNVWEWCKDRYNPDYYQNLSERNPRGPRRGYYRVLRGGSWISSPDFVRGFVRDRLDPYARGIHFGFRCARGTD